MRIKLYPRALDVTHIASGTSSGAYSYFQDGILYIATLIGEHNELHI